VVAFPPCKINLGLHVVRKRSDGYHELETCFFPIPWTDVLEIVRSSSFSFSSSGLDIPGSQDDNLCIKAYELLRQDFNLPPVSIHLHKVLPTGAGLGGGSSDAAHTLRLLNQIFELNCSQEQLSAYASRLGSDCAFFIYDSPMLGTGRGEVLSPISCGLKNLFIVLVKPPVHVSTKEAYAHVRPTQPARSIPDILAMPVSSWRELLVNDFEQSVFQSHPQISRLKDKMYAAGAVYACMSGSGSTVFGLFQSEPDVTAFLNDGMCWSGKLD